MSFTDTIVRVIDDSLVSLFVPGSNSADCFRPCCCWVRCTINRSHSTPCKKAEFEHLQFFPGHCLDFFLSVSGKIGHSPIKKVKRQPTLIISFSQHSPFFGEQSKIRAEIRPASDVTWGVRRGVCDKIVHTKMHFSTSA